MIPEHVAIIMDGNGRWAKARNNPRTFGHKKGSEVLKKICKDAYNIGIKYLTVYAFSTENWKRPSKEVDYLMGLLRTYLKDSVNNANKNNMRVRVIGRRNNLDNDIVKAIINMEEATKNNTGLNLIIAINYGARDEIIRAIQKCVVDVQKGLIENENLTEKDFEKYLDTKDIPDPELLIRTSGEIRLSNYLVWQLAYTEFYFTDCLWPDFNKDELQKAIDYYNKKDRRFGGVK